MILVASTIFHYQYFLPQLLKPTKYYLVDTVFQLAVALLIAMSAATVGARLLRLLGLRQGTRLERALLGYGLGTGALGLATAAIGLLHGYYFPILLAELLAPPLLWRADLAAVLRCLRPDRAEFVLAELHPRTVFESVVAALVATVGLIVVEHLAVPFWGFDVFMYHFALPKRFLALHQLFGSPGLPQANLPYNNEMLNLLALNFRAEVAAAIVQAIFVGALCLAIFALGARLFGRRVAWLGMAFFLVLPLVLYYASSGLIDPQFAFFAFTIILALDQYRATRDRRWILLAGLLTGIGFGIKYQTIYLVAPMLAPVIWWSRERDAWARSAALNLTLLGVSALGVFGLWAVREWVQVGNPIYPLIWGGADWTPQRLAVYRAQFDNFGSLRHSLLRYAIASFDWFLHWQKYDYSPTPPLPAYALAALAPLALLARGVRHLHGSVLLLLWLCLASFTLWGMVDQLVPRYVLPSFGLVALLAALVLDRAVGWIARALSSRARELILAASTLVALLPGVIYAVQTLTLSDPSPVFLGQQSYAAQVRATQLWPSYWKTVDYFNAEAPPDAKSLGIDVSATYFFDDPFITPDMNRDQIVFLAQVAPSDAAKLAWLRAHGYRYVLYDRTVKQWSIDRDPDHLLTPLYPPFEAFLAHELILVRSLEGTDVYLIP